ncbi:hypothetical protein, conserved [Leishmania tarentolae]|uniref:Uncharacterized protein n=1 Tax=Leishmania tarentolae TaxID=5689 RepID=A0A640KTK4_LEITA|nr:hypothetical protein, conserved [Leishmania tarentolae]
MMKFTHREIEEDRKKPVGSLFMHLIDRDSMPSRSHRNMAARKLNAHSLPNTALSFYPCDARERSSTPLRGRRHFPKKNLHVDCTKAEATRSPRGVGRVATPNANIDHIGGDMTPRASAEVLIPRQRRYVPPPARTSPHRPFWLGDDEIIASARSRRGAGRSSSVDSRSFSRNSSTTDHLTVGSLVPLPEKPVEKHVPPPLPIRPRQKGIRMFPGQRAHSAENPRRGIRMVQPQPHWRSAADRQWDFLELGVDRRETPMPLYRNESHIDLGGPITGHEGSSTPVQRWRGGQRYGVTPARRTFDIITGRPLVY